MKKILIIISLFTILLSSTPNVDFTLLDYFDGEYFAYSNVPLSKDYVSLGSCYMNLGEVDGKIIGESMIIQNCELASVIEELDAEIIMVEVLTDGTNVLYCHTDLIARHIKLDNKDVNLQIAQNYEYTVIGWPLILGSF